MCESALMSLASNNDVYTARNVRSNKHRRQSKGWNSSVGKWGKFFESRRCFWEKLDYTWEVKDDFAAKRFVAGNAPFACQAAAPRFSIVAASAMCRSCSLFESYEPAELGQTPRLSRRPLPAPRNPGIYLPPRDHPLSAKIPKFYKLPVHKLNSILMFNTRKFRSPI